MTVTYFALIYQVIQHSAHSNERDQIERKEGSGELMKAERIQDSQQQIQSLHSMVLQLCGERLGCDLLFQLCHYVISLCLVPMGEKKD